MAHEAHSSTLETWVHVARRLIRPGGVLTVIWRADGLGEILAAMGRGVGAIAVLPVHPKFGKPGHSRAGAGPKRGRRAPLRCWPGSC